MSEQNINDGGPAFPTLDNTEHWRHLGIPIRDYFAAAALTGSLAASHTDGEPEEFANVAYIIADAMLERRRR